MVDNSSKTKAFFCYSTSKKDEKFVDRIIDELKESGVKIWIDKTEIKAGDSIPDKISSGITTNTFFIIILSKNSVKSNWAKTERNAILMKKNKKGNNIVIIPAVIEKCEIPPLLEEYKRVDFTKDFSKALMEIVITILEILPNKGYEKYDYAPKVQDGLVNLNNKAADIMAESFEKNKNDPEKIKKLNESEKIFKYILQHHPSFAQSIQSLGQIQYEKALLGENEDLLHKSILTFKDALKYFQPDELETTYYTIGRSLARLSEYQSRLENKTVYLDCAIKYFDRSIENDRTFYLAYYWKGKSLIKRYNITKNDEDIKNAKSSFLESVRYNPESIEPLKKLIKSSEQIDIENIFKELKNKDAPVEPRDVFKKLEDETISGTNFSQHTSNPSNYPWKPEFYHYDDQTIWKNSRGRLVKTYDRFDDVIYCNSCDEPLRICKCR